MNVELRLPCLLRPFEERDAGALEWFGTQTPFRAALERSVRRHRSGLITLLIADVNGFPAGRMNVKTRPDLEHDLGRETIYEHMTQLAVFAPFQGMGIGTHLIAAAERHLAQHGIETARIGVGKDNSRAQALYERLGYRVFGDALDEYDYRTPEGETVHVRNDIWLLEKRLNSR
jgi:ribosomal protein S18 acetylase RimI-like enzyme